MGHTDYYCVVAPHVNGLLHGDSACNATHYDNARGFEQATRENEGGEERTKLRMQDSYMCTDVKFTTFRSDEWKLDVRHSLLAWVHRSYSIPLSILYLLHLCENTYHKILIVVTLPRSSWVWGHYGGSECHGLLTKDLRSYSPRI